MLKSAKKRLGKRTRLIPLIGALGVMTTNAACGLPIIGNWLATQITYTPVGGPAETYTLPYTYSYTNYGITYTVVSGWRLLVDNDLDGLLRNYYTSSDTTGYSYTDSYDTVVTVDKVKRKRYTLRIPDVLDFAFDCVIDRRELACSGTDAIDQSVTEFVFEKD